MSEELEMKDLNESLDAYKSKISQVNKATLTWDKDLIFVGRTNRGYEVEYDAQQQWGCSPTETLLLSVAGCMGIDMVSFLKKMKVEIKSYKMDIVGEREPHAAPVLYGHRDDHRRCGVRAYGQEGRTRHLPFTGQVLFRVPLPQKRHEGEGGLYV